MIWHLFNLLIYRARLYGHCSAGLAHLYLVTAWELTLVPSVLIGAGLVSHRVPVLIRGSLIYIEHLR